MNRREVFLERLQIAPMDRKVKVIKAMEAYDRLDYAYGGISKTIDRIRETLDEVYPDNWDIIISKNYSDKHNRTGWYKKLPFTIEFVIHFPELKITNRDDLSYILRGFYIKLMPTLTNEGISFKAIKGKRMIATKSEVISQYQHSHISGKPYKFHTDKSDTAFAWRSFCMGSSEMIQALSMLSSRFESGRFKLVLFQLEEYLNYESIEGTPYKYLHDVVGGGKLVKPTETSCNNYYEELLNMRKVRLTPKVKIDFKLEGDKVRVVDNDKFEQYLKMYGNAGSYISNHIAQRNENGIYYGYKNIPGVLQSSLVIQPEEFHKIAFYFKGEIVNFQVVTIEDEENKPFFINKHIKNYVKTRIEEGIEAQRFRSYIIEQLNTSTYLSANIEQDRVSVSAN